MLLEYDDHYKARIVPVQNGYVIEVVKCEWNYIDDEPHALYGEIVDEIGFVRRKDAVKSLKKKGFKYGKSIFGGYAYFWS